MSREATFPWQRYVLWAFVIIGLALSPLIPSHGARLVAEANSCHLDMDFISFCMIGDTDWGTTLDQVWSLGWLVLITVPLGLISLAILAVLLRAGPAGAIRKRINGVE